ncbi:MAG: TonB-dependent receptor plug domain-containing protein, partial [Bacteroidota bacterium]
MANFELTQVRNQIGEVVIQGGITGPVRRAGDALFTGSAITREGISLMGISANNSVYNSLDIMPGITIEGNDAYGLSDKTVRIRGIRSTFSGMTIEGFPNYGIMPIGARDDIYDMENINSVSVYKGAAPADLGTATGSKGGVIELKYKRPADTLKVNLQHTAGSSAYLRSF